MGERSRQSVKKPETKIENSLSQLPETNLPHSKKSPISSFLHLQRTIGNQAVQRLFQSIAIQAKLKIGQPGDKYEQEAGSVAERVVDMSDFNISRQENEEDIQTKSVADQITPLAQRQSPEEEEEDIVQAKERPRLAQEFSPPAEVGIQSMKGGGQPLPKSTRAFFEPRFGYDFSNVRVHADAQALEAAQSINARAFTIGQNVVFGSGHYAPETTAGKRLLAHELTHVMQQAGNPGQVLQRTNDQENPSRYRTVYEHLFVRSRSGAQMRPWVNQAPGVAGTAADIITQYKAFLRALIAANPMSVGGTISTQTTESAAETDAIAIDARIRSRFPHISVALPESAIRAAVGILQPSQTSNLNFLREWLANQLSRRTDVDEYNIQESDSRFQQMLTDLFNDSYAGPHIRTLASRQAAFVDSSSGNRQIYLHRGADPNLRKLVLIHELMHFYAAQDYKNWIGATTAERFYNEGFTEYLSRLVMTPAQRTGRRSYNANVQAIEQKVARYVPDDDIARAYFKGEVWRLEDRSAVAQQLFGVQTGIQEGSTRRTEVAQSLSSPGIVQVVNEGRHYRFMNFGVNRHALKPEHMDFLRNIYSRYITSHANVLLRFIGYASSPGSTRLNLALSRERSAAFYRFARNIGVPSNQLLDEANPPHRGETMPTAQEIGVQSRAFNRRVELFITQSSPSSAIQ